MGDKEQIWYFDFFQQWTEILSRKYNWKNFTVIILTGEYSDYLRAPGYFELQVGLLGFGLTVTRIPPGMTEGLQELVDSLKEAQPQEQQARDTMEREHE